MNNKFILTLDASQVFLYQTCALQWFYRYKENLALDAEQAVAPDKGTLIHELLSIYYNLKLEQPKESHIYLGDLAIQKFKREAFTKILFPQDDGTLEDFLCQRFALYVSRWLNDDFTPLKDGIEVGFSHLLYEDSEVKFILEGRIDLIHKIQDNLLCFTDHKTQSKRAYLYHYTPQFKTYALVTGFEYGMINYFGLQEDKSNKLLRSNDLFRRELIYFKPAMLDEWREKLITTFTEIYSILTANMTGSPEELFYARRNDSACQGFYNYPCHYTALCEEHNWEMKQRIKAFKYLKTLPWSPWEPKTNIEDIIK